MADILLSIVVPVYNVEQYLEECVSSLLTGATEQVEIILVDDGSTDGSGLLCDQLAAGQECIRVLHQENAGPSVARNEGIRQASGKYLAFVDSDDRLSQGALEQVLQWCQTASADICFMQAVKFFPDGTQQDLGDCITARHIRNRAKEEIWSFLAARPKYPGSSCTKLFYRAFFQKNGFYFPEDRRSVEDLDLCMAALYSAQTFDALDFRYYEYRQCREGSSTYRVTDRAYDDLCTFVSKWADRLTDAECRPVGHTARCAMSFVAYEYSILLWRYGDITGAMKTQVRCFLKQYRWVLGYGVSRRLRAVNLLLRLCGIPCTAQLLKLYKRAEKRSS